MAITTYTSPPVNTPAKRTRAYFDMEVFIQHLGAGTGDYVGIDLVSIAVDAVTHIVTIVVSNPIPARQLARYNLT